MILDSAATMDVAGAYLVIHYQFIEQSILSHPSMTVAYRNVDGSTGGSESYADNMPGLVDDSDEKDENEDADMVYDLNVQLPTQSSSSTIMTNNNLMTNTMQDSVCNDMALHEEAMCKFMTELRVAETDMIKPEYIDKCHLCSLFRYPDDPKHVDIFHLHVFCTVCQQYEGAYLDTDRCDKLPTMDEQMMQPINNVDDNEQANVVFIPNAIYC
jgi:hypothetical protein